MIIGIFNNKGGVGKTTYLYHLAHTLSAKGKTVLLIDGDPQCNLTAYALDDAVIERSWSADRGNSIFNAIEPLHESMGDFRKRRPTQVNPEDYPNLWIVPGDPALSNFEDTLGDAWRGARGGNAADLRKQSALYRFASWASNEIKADFTFLDLGPNLGPLNRTCLTSCDYFIVPVSPDLFSIRGTLNLGRKLVMWRRDWDNIRIAGAETEIDLPAGAPMFLGYMRQQYNVRADGEEGMTAGWRIFGQQIEGAIQQNIVSPLRPLGQVIDWDDGEYDLGNVPNLHSLVPYSQDARKPIFDCNGADGVRGAHLARAREARALFEPMAESLINLLSR